MTISRPRTLAHGVVPAYAAEAVRRRVRARWERRRAATAAPTIVTMLSRPSPYSNDPLGVRVRPDRETIEKLVASPKYAAHRHALIERIER